MPVTSNSEHSTPHAATAPVRMLRLRRAGWILKSLASFFVFAFLCAYIRTTLRYGTPPAQTLAPIAHPLTQASFTPTRSHSPHRRQVFLRRAHQARRPARHSHPYYLVSLRRIRRLFSQLLVMRS